MKMPEDDIENFSQATRCHICDKELGDDKVRDPFHLSGQFRGAGHRTYNLSLNANNIEIPVFFHTLKDYDGRLIISSAIEFRCRRINVIAQNSEKFITLGFNNIHVKDRYSFLSSSLDKLVRLNEYRENKTQRMTTKTRQNVLNIV